MGHGILAIEPHANRNFAMRRILDLHEASIDEIVAACNGDMRGAVKALMLVNEQLESELRQVYAATEHGSPAADPTKPIVH
jgi:hypothetical protein